MVLTEELTQEEFAEAYAADEKARTRQAVVGLIRGLKDHDLVPETVRKTMGRLLTKAGHEPWFELRVGPDSGWQVDYSNEDGERILTVGPAFAQLNEAGFDITPDNYQQVRQAMAEVVYCGAICADGHKDWAENRQKEFLTGVNDEAGVAALVEGIKEQFVAV